jgi:chromosome segregation ATPase
MDEQKVKEYQDAIEKKDKQMKLLIQRIKSMESTETDYRNLKESFNKKEEECRNLQEKIKFLEKKTEDVYKNVSSAQNISDVSELRKQFENNAMVLNNLIDTYKQNINEKNDNIQNLSKELSQIQGQLEEEKKKNESLSQVNLVKYDPKSQEMQQIKISSENSSLKQRLINSEEKVERLQTELQNLKQDQIEKEKQNKINYDLVKSELSHKSKSYTQLLKDFQTTNQSLNHICEDLEKSKYFAEKYEKESQIQEKKYFKLENELFEIKSENMNLKSQIKGNEIELESLRKRVKELESKFNEAKLSKQIFPVNYFYMRMQIQGHIIFQKEGDKKYVLYIENRVATRSFSFLDAEIRKDQTDPTKIFVKLIKENAEEEYFTNESNKLVECYENFKKKAIENADFSTTSTVKENQPSTVSTQNPENMRKKLNKNLFEF